MRRSILAWLMNQHAKKNGSQHSIREVVAGAELAMTDRTSFLKTRAVSRFVTDPICYADIGARFGLANNLQAFKNLLSPIYFEPDEEEFENLVRADPSAKIINAGISGESGLGTLYLTKKRGCSSLLHPSGSMLGILKASIDGGGRSYDSLERLSVEQTVQVRTLRLSDAIPFDATPIDILKIDTQGSEYEVLTGIGDHRPFLVCAECSTTEVYKDQKSVFAVGSLLESLGYFPLRFMDDHPVPRTRSSWQSSLQFYGDVIFVPNNSQLGRQIIVRDVEKWFASLCMFGYLDFALWQLDELEIDKPALVVETIESLN